MKAAGIVRRIDDLGRIVIPKEVRNNLRLREGEPVEIFVDRQGEVILKKYSPVEQLKDFAQEYADVLFHTTKHSTIITDRDKIIAKAGETHEFDVEDSITNEVEEVINTSRVATLNTSKNKVFSPIIAQGDVMGTVIIVAYDDSTLSETEVKLADTAAKFIAKNIEE